MIYRYCLSILGAGALLSTAQAEKPTLTDGTLTLRAGDYTATFLEDAFWTLETLDFKDVPIITPTGANQTVVKLNSSPDIAPKDEWIGTKHGGEVVESISLEVDGKEYKLGTTLEAPAGERYAVVKVARFGPYRGWWRVELDASGLKETAQFEQIGDIEPIAYAYVFMHCWSPRMQDWLALLQDGSQVNERFPDEDSKSLQEDISTLAVYSADEETGAVLVYPKVYAGFRDRKSFLNYFPQRHNKLYLTVSKNALTAETYSCRIQAFQAEPDAWQQTALDLVAKISEGK